jgi:hypothetical protein
MSRLFLIILSLMCTGSAYAEEPVVLLNPHGDCQNPVYVQVVVTACPAVEKALEPRGQGEISNGGDEDQVITLRKTRETPKPWLKSDCALDPLSPSQTARRLDGTETRMADAQGSLSRGFAGQN